MLIFCCLSRPAPCQIGSLWVYMTNSTPGAAEKPVKIAPVRQWRIPRTVAGLPYKRGARRFCMGGWEKCLVPGLVPLGSILLQRTKKVFLHCICLVPRLFPLGSHLVPPYYTSRYRYFFNGVCLVPDLVPLGSIQFLTSTKTDVLHRSDAKNQCAAARYQSALYVTLVFVSVFYFYV